MSGPRRSQRQTLTGLHHLNYDAKYHPIDDAIRPTQARKRKRAHLADDTVDPTSDDDTNTTNSPAPTARRRSRRPSSSTPIYKGHPQDEQLKAAGAFPARRSKTIVIHSDTEVDDDSDEPGHTTNSAPLTPATTSNTNRKRDTGSRKSRALDERIKSQKQKLKQSLTNSRETEQQASAYQQAWEALATLALTQGDLEARGYQQIWEGTVQEYERESHKWDLSGGEVASDEEDEPGNAPVDDGDDIHETGNALMNELEAQDDDGPSNSSMSTTATCRLSGYDSGHGPPEGHTADHHESVPITGTQEPKDRSLLELSYIVPAQERSTTEEDTTESEEDEEEEEGEGGGEEKGEEEEVDEQPCVKNHREAEALPQTPTRKSEPSAPDARLSSRLQRIQASAGKVHIVGQVLELSTKPTQPGRWGQRKATTSTGHDDDVRPVSAQSDMNGSFNEVFETTVFHRERERSEEL